MKNVELRIPCLAEDSVESGFHKHKCDSCGTTWKHCRAHLEAVSSDEHKEAHTCPNCGGEQFYIHRTEAEERERKCRLGDFGALLFELMRLDASLDCGESCYE